MQLPVNELEATLEKEKEKLKAMMPDEPLDISRGNKNRPPLLHGHCGHAVMFYAPRTDWFASFGHSEDTFWE